MKRSNAIRGAGVLVGAVALTLGTGVPAAQAGVTQDIRTARSGAWFYHFGDRLVVSDYKFGDGYGARAYLTWGKNKKEVYANGRNNPTSELNLDIKENTTVWLQLCFTKNGKNTDCSSTQRAVA